MTKPLPIVGYINPLVADALRDPTSGINVTQLRAERNGCVSAPLVLKTDADAEIAKLRAEIECFHKALESIEMGIDALPDDNEDYSRMTAREMQRQALIIVKEELKALKGPAA
ncbi:hypothetical protein [Acetobacter cerevisiae]|uniref:hypothetical protein n=1 Tax=Acetobacter cerevisiae TaxID=178900 RepID=UPI00209FAC7B|nr:hypothetical protein [Acetobacter cerevisiae]MCP1271252.1 hypothetical protein [Acetobacter cerevisiae]MCP1279206.1 hypothetical protein [Acetobacter cerevisiae]